MALGSVSGDVSLLAGYAPRVSVESVCQEWGAGCAPITWLTGDLKRKAREMETAAYQAATVPMVISGEQRRKCARLQRG